METYLCAVTRTIFTFLAKFQSKIILETRYRVVIKGEPQIQAVLAPFRREISLLGNTLFAFLWKIYHIALFETVG